jgi:hypothetical protein
MTHTDIQAKVIKTATFDGSSIDISAAGLATTDWTLVLEVLAMNDANAIRFQFSDSVDAFSTVLAGPTVCISGKIDKSDQKRYTFFKRDFPNLRFGTASAVLRLSITEFTGSSKSVTYQAYLET